ncbi:MAG: hypothetical protein KF691_01030 [Phycisphaeraceae bacterium]|nr:hypothetical protein [Phycisphaeraceae bacterium]
MRVADLMEAEGRSFSRAIREEGRTLRSAASRFGIASAAVIVSSLFIALGIITCLIAVFLALTPPLGMPAAAAITGALAIAIGAVLLIVAHFLSK